MDKMKQEVKDKMKYWERLCALFAILMSTNIWNYARTMNGGDAFADFFKGFQLGIYCMWSVSSYAIPKNFTG